MGAKKRDLISFPAGWVPGTAHGSQAVEAPKLWSSPGLTATVSLGHTKTETMHMSNCLKNAVANGDLRQHRNLWYSLDLKFSLLSSVHGQIRWYKLD